MEIQDNEGFHHNSATQLEPLFVPREHPDATQMVIHAIANRTARGVTVPKVRVDISSTSYKLVPETEL